VEELEIFKTTGFFEASVPFNRLDTVANTPTERLTYFEVAIVIERTSDPTIQKMQDDSLATLSPDPFHFTPQTNDRAFPVRFSRVPALSMLTSDPYSECAGTGSTPSGSYP
jgi:hypothetical protein